MLHGPWSALGEWMSKRSPTEGSNGWDDWVWVLFYFWWLIPAAVVCVVLLVKSL